MKYQYARLRKTNFATMDNDAKACYDRIIMLLATIASGHFGIPKAARDLQARTIRKMQFHIKTALGISKDCYTHSEETPLHGSGQGSGSSAPIWLFISSIIMDCFEDIASGMTMANMDGTEKITQWIDGFVDDTSIFTNQDSTNDDPTTTATTLQQDAVEWNALLAATGGKLELTKCFFYILHWKFDAEGNPSPMTKEELDDQGVSISIHEADYTTATTIKHLDCNTARRTLGLYKSPTANQDAQITNIQEKSKRISDNIAASAITRSQATIAWNSIYIPAITYPLVATYINEPVLTKIENKALSNFLPKMGYNRNTARAVIYGPETLGGVGIKHLYVEQSIEQIKAFTQHTRLSSPLGKTIQINLDWVQLIAGTHQPVLVDTKKLPHIEGEWFVSIRTFLRSIKGEIRQTTGWRPQLERLHDQCLMDILTPPSKTDAIRINRCRIYLQATTIADITCEDGTRINDYAWTAKHAHSITNPRKSKHAWPRQPRPGPKAWKAWKSAIQRHLSSRGKGQNLKQPLGPWTVSPTQSRQTWEWYIDHPTNRLIHHTTEKTTAYPLTEEGGQQQHDTTRPTIIATIPNTAIPTRVGRNYSTRNKPNQIQQTAQPTPTTFQEYIDHLDPWEQNLAKHTPDHEDHHLITSQLNNDSKIIIVSDGGMADGYGSYGWTIAVNNTQILGRGEAQGHRDLMQSFRAEGYGMLAALRYLLHMCTFEKTWPQTNKTIHTYSDNLGLIQRLGWHKKRITTTPKNVSAPDYDIEIAIINTMKQLADKKIIINTMHVKGHQDKFTQYHQLPREAQLNVDADAEATAALNNHSKTERYNAPPDAKTTLYIDGQPITSKEATTISTMYLSKILQTHMIKRENWQDDVPDTICWDAHKKSLQKLDKTDKTRIHKFLHRCLPTNKKLHDIDAEHPAKCPACQEVETNDHVSACSNPRRDKLRRELLSNLSKILDKHDTHQQIKECMILGLKKILANDLSPITTEEVSFSPTGIISEALEEQENIGWANFYRGRLSTKWLDAQQDFAKRHTNQSDQDTVQWAVQIITTLWHGFLQMWEERKQDQHGRDVIQQNDSLRRNLLKKTNLLYSKLHLFDEEDKRLFVKPVEHWEQASNKDIQDWITLAEPLAEKSISRAKTRLSQNQSTITQFFSATTRETIQRHAQTHNRRPPRQTARGGYQS